MKNKFFKAISQRIFVVLTLALLVVISLNLTVQSSVVQKVDRFRIQFDKKIQKLPTDSSIVPSSRRGKLKALGLVSATVSDKNYSAEKIIVKFRPQMSIQAVNSILQAYNTRPEKLIPRINVHVARVVKPATVEETLFALQKNPDVIYAEPVYKLWLCETPNDPLFRHQYALYNPGGVLQIPGSPSGTSRADIKATSAWDYAKGSENLLVAVLDTGVDYNHPDLKNKVVSHGKDFVNSDDDAYDDHWHGTHVSGIVAAETNNAEGIAGVAWYCKILPGKIISAAGEGDYDWLIEALIWAADFEQNGKKVGVINMSIGGDQPSLALEEALEYCFNKGIVLVASTGNDGGPVLYPAAYDQYCLAVGASDYNDLIADFSNYGPEVDVVAPGVWILSTFPMALTEPGYLPYAYASGTSMSAPHVAGLVALIKSKKPWLSPAEIMKIIKYTADDVATSGRDDYAGYGRINSERALKPYRLK
ncbi:MAG: peptidase S8 [Candidatus Aminicenantes bacterium]|nr:peptidase S8 [Candidatus Aminicenantes bacterium]